MILKDKAFEFDRPGADGFITPQYDNYCFSNLPSLVQYFFGLKNNVPLSDLAIMAGLSNVESPRVIVFLVDGFGYYQWLEYFKKYDFLTRVVDNGLVSPVTAVFPSTTAAAVTSMHSGLTPQEHGLPEWWVYFQELGKVIVTLPFMRLDGKSSDELLQSGVDPAILFDGETWYGKLSNAGITSFNLVPRNIANSAYSSRVLKSTHVIPFGNAHDLMTRLLKLVTESVNPAYFHVYWGDIDSAAHKYGLHSNKYLAALDDFFPALTGEFLDKIPPDVARKTIILMVADHGQLNVDPKATIYLNKYPGLVNKLRIGPDGEKILPWGSARDVFFALKEGATDEVYAFLSDTFDGKASVIRTENALEQGLFGRGWMHREFKNRIGDILLLPYDNTTLWYERPYHKEFNLLGMHGGLSRDEMLVPLAMARLSDLV